MYWNYILPLLLTGVSSAPTNSVQERDVPDNTAPYGTNPIKAISQYLGKLIADNSCSHRDLGFTGSIGGKWFAIYGDTLWCAPGVSDPTKDDQSSFHGMVRDSVSAVTTNPLRVHDLNLNNDSPVPHQLQFVPFNTAWGEDGSTGFGGTSLVEVDGANGVGAIYYLVNQNDKGLKGAGVAQVNVVNGVPKVTKRYDLFNTGYWWNYQSFARYGDVAAYRDVNSDYIYILGGAPNMSSTDWVQSSYVYQARVHAADAFNISKYEYWWGRTQGFKLNQPLQTFNKETAVLWGSGQGQIVYSTFYNCYIFVGLGGSKVNLRTAATPYGPWSAAVEVYTVKTSTNGYAYAGVAHPYLDTTGKTLTVSYTNYPNDIEAVKISFSK